MKPYYVPNMEWTINIQLLQGKLGVCCILTGTAILSFYSLSQNYKMHTAENSTIIMKIVLTFK